MDTGTLSYALQIPFLITIVKHLTPYSIPFFVERLIATLLGKTSRPFMEPRVSVLFSEKSKTTLP
jgi:hypothetical protein